MLERVARLTAAGYSQRDIAAKLDIHQTTVGKYQKKAGVAPNGHTSERRRDKARRNYREVCAAFGVGNLFSIPGLRRRVEAAKKGVVPC
ncbi:hypothetical protein VT84_09465 [Gemmata sp. SH-PL17]|uniref:helix-turn-helix domain-containing protein n=1 Tax=Gemmata sp. SH-PL17 TaxID=1630693 RepID=UPI00078E5303|nr:helix-turn-helix domain-containing protein [Gemmata sp. SH-PL17]AMV24612.1 hypothetical protein VT84_09465 [Gemmata sp. SH-PL17]